jgi:hypothetical protein
MNVGMLEEEGEQVCVPVECNKRIPWENKKCSTKEDFIFIDDGDEGDENENIGVKCFYYQGFNDEFGRCVLEEECPEIYRMV